MIDVEENGLPIIYIEYAILWQAFVSLVSISIYNIYCWNIIIRNKLSYDFCLWYFIKRLELAYPCGCEPVPSLERDSLNWVTSTDRLFWKPDLVPVFHGSLIKKIPIKKIRIE